MAIIRKMRFSQSGDINPDDIALIDTPEKLLKFAEIQGLQAIPLDVVGIAEKFGISLEYISLEDDLSGIFYKENSSWIMHCLFRYLLSHSH